MKDLKLVVKAGSHNRKFCPICAEIQLSEPLGNLTLSLIETESGNLVPSQSYFLKNLNKLRVHWILDSLSKGEEREYALRFERSLRKPLGLGVGLREESKGKISFYVGGRLFTRYNFGGNVIRPYLHPVLGPESKPVTRGFPMIPDIPGETRDHPHHRSIWTAHGDVNGVDDWSEAPNCGRIVHRRFKKLIEGPIFGELLSLNDWVSHEGEKVLEEVRRITIYDTPDDVRIMDVEANFKATEGDVTFGDTKEGGVISVRVAFSIDVVNGGKIENSYGGVNEEETWGKRAHWCDYSGPVGDSWIGIAIFDHPENLRHPTYWHVRDYGLMTANPFGISYFTGNPKNNGSLTLERDETLLFRYRLLIHKGDAEAGKVKDRYHDFINPPKVTLE